MAQHVDTITPVAPVEVARDPITGIMEVRVLSLRFSSLAAAYPGLCEALRHLLAHVKERKRC